MLGGIASRDEPRGALSALLKVEFGGSVDIVTPGPGPNIPETVGSGGIIIGAVGIIQGGRRPGLGVIRSGVVGKPHAMSLDVKSPS